MIYTIIGAVLGLCFFIIPFWAYRRGLQDGLSINAGKAEIKPIQPIQEIKKQANIVEVNKMHQQMETLINEGITNLMQYDGTPQKKVD